MAGAGPVSYTHLSASFPRLDVAFLGPERERMLDGDDTRPFLVCNAPLGGYLRPVVIDTPCDRIAQVHIQLHEMCIRDSCGRYPAIQKLKGTGRICRDRFTSR